MGNLGGPPWPSWAWHRASATEGATFKPARTVKLGDRHYDVHGALESGVTPVGSLWGYGEHDELHGAGCRALVEPASEFTQRYVV